MAITTLKKLEEETARSLRDDFNEREWENPRAIWSETGLKLASCYGLVDLRLRPVNKAAARILAICKKEWDRGQPDAKKND